MILVLGAALLLVGGGGLLLWLAGQAGPVFRVGVREYRLLQIGPRYWRMPTQTRIGRQCYPTPTLCRVGAGALWALALALLLVGCWRECPLC